MTPCLAVRGWSVRQRTVVGRVSPPHANANADGQLDFNLNGGESRIRGIDYLQLEKADIVPDRACQQDSG